MEQGFVSSLFHGVIAEELVTPFPEIADAERERLVPLLDELRRFADAHIDPARIDAEASLPREVLSGLGKLGVFGLRVAREHGGLGLSMLGEARVLSELASIDGSIAMTVGAHASLGSMALHLFGDEAQQRRYLPRLSSGQWLAAFALTEVGAGSDAAAIATRAERSPDGEGYVLDGEKIWVTNGALADVFTVFARTSTHAGQKPKITAFVVERAHGVETFDDEAKLGVRGASTTRVKLDGVQVPAENVIGEVGRGFRVATEVLDHGRLGVAASCVGACKQLLSLSLERVNERRAFGRSIGQFGLIKEKIARMTSELFALESAVFLTASLVDRRAVSFSLESALVKVLGSETLWRVANETLEIAAGRGYMAAWPYERLLRDARVHLVYQGTNEILRCFLALSGMQGPGQALVDVKSAMREPIKGFGLLSDFALRKAKSAFGRERLHRVHPLLAKETVVFEESVAELSRIVDKVLRKHGREIAEMQFTQRRIADLTIDLYALLACLLRATRAIERRGEEGARREVELTFAFAGHAHERIDRLIRAFDHNDDDLLKGIAARGYADGRYPFDLL
jgi:acyl-CoA dehydrogenase family protein 9